MYEEWMESAFRENFETDEDCKYAIQLVRKHILNSIS